MTNNYFYVYSFLKYMLVINYCCNVNVNFLNVLFYILNGTNFQTRDLAVAL